MFSITCDSCATKLKVGNPRVIGQRLACPRCGHMLLVKAPPGFVVPPSDRSPDRSFSSDDAGSAEQNPDSFENSEAPDFDDIQSAIAAELERQEIQSQKAGTAKVSEPDRDSDSPLAMPPNRAAANSAFVSAEAIRRRTKAHADADRFSKDKAPLAGPEDWTSPAAKRTRTILLSTIGGLLLIGLVAALLWVLNRNQPSKPVAVDSTESAAGTQSAPTEASSSAQLKDPSILVSELPDDSAKPEVVSATPEPDLSSSEEKPPATDQEPRPEGATPPMPAIPGLDDPATAASPAQSESDQTAAATKQEPNDQKSGDQEPGDQARPKLPTPPGLKDPPAQASRPAAEAQVAPPTLQSPDPSGSFDELGALVQSQGVTLSEIEKAAAGVLPEVRPGIPEFVIEQDDPPVIPGADEVFATQAGLVEFKQQRLTLVVRDMSSISGLPVAWDLRAVLAAGIDPAAETSFAVRNGTLGEAFRSAIEPAGLELLTTPWGLALFPQGDGNVAERRWKLDGPPGIEAGQRLELFASQIPQLFVPGDWAEPEFRATVENGEVVVVHRQRTLRSINAIVDRLKELAADPQATKPTAIELADELLDRPIGLKTTVDAPVESFLGRIERELGMTILIDWSVAGPVNGWGLKTVIPGHLTASTGRELLDKLAAGLGLTWQAIGPSHFVLTTPAAAAVISDVEVYPVAKLLDAGFTGDGLKELLARATAGKLPAGSWTSVWFDPVAKALVISAPQSGLRQVSAILKSLDKSGRLPGE